MGELAVGSVVLVVFPYADFSRYKKRPALIVGLAEFNNFILCQITSSPETSQRAIRLAVSGFSEGGLMITSFIRPDKIVTVEKTVIQEKIGQLTPEMLNMVLNQIQQLFSID